MKYIPQVGSVSTGTLKIEDLLPVFFNELKKLKPEVANEVAPKGINADAMDTEEMEFVFEDICDYLNEYAPEGLMFGGHPGDPADWGWWLAEDGEDDMDYDDSDNYDLFWGE